MNPALGIFLLLFLSCCKKADNRQYSYWHVDNDSFETNDVRADIGKARCELTTNNYHEGFQFHFNLGNFPQIGNYTLGCSIQNPMWVCFGILHKDTGYLSNEPVENSLIATQVNGKGCYALKPTWFYNSYRHSDSILVHGIFNEP